MCYFYFLENVHLNIIFNVIILQVCHHNTAIGCSIFFNLVPQAGWSTFLVTKPKGSCYPSPGLFGSLMLI